MDMIDIVNFKIKYINTYVKPDIFQNEYYIIYLSSENELYSTQYFLKSYKFNDKTQYYNSSSLEPKFFNIKKLMNEFIKKKGKLYGQYIFNIFNCFNSSHNINENNDELILLLNTTNNNIIFSFRINSQDVIYDLCKTSNPIYNDIKISEFMKSFLIHTRYNYYIYLDFDEPNYQKTIRFLTRSGFSIKGPTSLTNKFILDDYTKNKRYLLLSYNYKKKYTNTMSNSNSLSIALNIKNYENKIKTKFYQLENSSIRKIISYLFNWSTEISGSFTKKNNFTKNSIEQVLENLNENINFNDGYEVKFAENLKKNKCMVENISFNIINYHTHPLVCYLNKKKIRFLDPPSRGDLISIFLMIDELVNNNFKCHLVFTLECIYVFQIHPYWIEKLKYKKKFFVSGFYDYLFVLIKNFKKFELTIQSFSNPKKILELLYFYNNKFTFNELSKNIQHNTIDELTEHPSDLTKDDEIRQWYKNRYYASDLDRNMNLLLFSIIPYNWKKETDLLKLDFTEFPRVFFDYLDKNSKEISKLIKYIQDNLTDENLKIPYYYLQNH